MQVMWRSRMALALIGALVLTGLSAAPASAQAVRVIVDGSPVAFDQPPVTIGGRVLIPLRGVLERIGAFVQWNPANNTVLASRGTTQIQLTIGSRIAYVNGRAVSLDVPALVVRGRTLVPLRFVSESIGASVDWDASSRTVFITSGTAARPPFPQPPVVQPPVQPPVVQPPLPPVPSQSVIQGIVSRVDAANNRLYVQRGDQILTVFITPDTAITGTAGAISLNQLRPGDAVTVTIDAQSRAILVRAQTAGAPTAQVRITSITHNAQRALRSGETLTVTMQGTPGGQATFDIFGVAQGIPMTEVSPGVYRGTYTIRPNDSILSAGVFGRLRVGGQEAVAQAEALVSVDGRAPVIQARIPQPDSVINNQRPNILILFDDQGGSGINPSASVLIVNGQNVTANAVWTETSVSYTPPQSLPQGTIAVQTILRDRAGNQTTDAFAFTIGVAQGALLRAVTVSPSNVVQVGQVLTVTAVGEPGGQAAFSIEGVASNVAMTETQPGVYVGQYTVTNQTAQNARVLVTLTRGGQTATLAASSRVSFFGSGIGAQPTILTPTAGTRVGAPIVIRGTAPPGSRVVVRVDYSGTLLLFQVNGTYGQVATTADASGTWEVSIRPSIRIPNARLTITARTIDVLGRESATTTVEVIQG